MTKWPERLTLRDTKVQADEGQRIYTTATGYGYEKCDYVRADLAAIDWESEPKFDWNNQDGEARQRYVNRHNQWCGDQIEKVRKVTAPSAPERPLVEELTGALRFIMAFYEPGQRYLDTEAWKHAEAGGRRALARGEAAIKKGAA